LNPSADGPSTEWGRVQTDPPGQICVTRAMGVRLTRLNEIVKVTRGITSETGWMLAGALGTSPEFWLNLQMIYDLALAPAGPRQDTPEQRSDQWQTTKRVSHAKLGR